ncbi:MAG: class I SAM-dependent methyltransferase [Spirochaetia bacterium]|nr:class I SAM-dependent methyltransferase [Spirochaetia bacterium]
MNKTNFDDKASQWDKKPLRLILAETAANALKENIPLSKNMKALEFGCGTGLVTMQIASELKSVLAVDSSEKMLDELAKKIEAAAVENIKPVFLDIENGREYLNDKFNLIYSSMTLHHIQDTEDLISFFSQKLLPEGILALIDLQKEDGTFHNDNTGVKHFGFETKYLIEIFEKLGFKNIICKTIYTIVKEDLKEYPVFLIVGAL